LVAGTARGLERGWQRPSTRMPSARAAAPATTTSRNSPQMGRGCEAGAAAARTRQGGTRTCRLSAEKLEATVVDMHVHTVQRCGVVGAAASHSAQTVVLLEGGKTHITIRGGTPAAVGQRNGGRWQRRRHETARLPPGRQCAAAISEGPRTRRGSRGVAWWRHAGNAARVPPRARRLVLARWLVGRQAGIIIMKRRGESNGEEARYAGAKQGVREEEGEDQWTWVRSGKRRRWGLV